MLVIDHHNRGILIHGIAHAGHACRSTHRQHHQLPGVRNATMTYWAQLRLAIKSNFGSSTIGVALGMLHMAVCVSVYQRVCQHVSVVLDVSVYPFGLAPQASCVTTAKLDINRDLH